MQLLFAASVQENNYLSNLCITAIISGRHFHLIRVHESNEPAPCKEVFAIIVLIHIQTQSSLDATPGHSLQPFNKVYCVVFPGMDLWRWILWGK